MKEVMQHGIMWRWKIKCKCGCVFNYDETDITCNFTTDDKFVVTCPECRRILDHEEAEGYSE